MIPFSLFFEATEAENHEKTLPPHTDLCVENNPTQFIIVTLIYAFQALWIRIIDHGNKNVHHDERDAEAEKVENPVLAVVPLLNPELGKQALPRCLEAIIV